MKNWLIGILLLTIVKGYCNDFEPLQALISRQFPDLEKKVIFQKIEQTQEMATYEVFDNMLHIKASTKSAALYALTDYLKKYCQSSLSRMEKNINIPKKLPKPFQKETVSAAFPLRYAYNYCTINYTMSFYSWDDWQEELDLLALSGVNLALAPAGYEAVWQNTLLKLGYSPNETLDFIPGPAFSAWWLMGNLEGWGGKISQQMIDNQVVLQKKILARMNELGIQPLMHGFYGMVPSNLDQKGYNVLQQGHWAGGFLRPALLFPDENFSKIADIYYSELKQLYGTHHLYFAGDPFHEGGNSKEIQITEYGKLIQQKMMQNFPKSTWVLQGWGGNPSSELLSQLNKNQVLVQELFGENDHYWEQRNGYENTPFIWCSVTNFGEKTGLNGKLQRFSDEIYRLKMHRYKSLAKGVGIMPEGLHNNPVVYDFILDLAWKSQKIETKQWIENYTKARYGKKMPEIIIAWQEFLETIYSSPSDRQEGAPESVFCMRPSLDKTSVSSWGARKRLYDTDRFQKAVALFLSVDKKMKHSKTYQVDKIDFLRQVLANKGEKAYENMVNAYKNHQKDKFEEYSAVFLSLIELQDDLLSSNSHFQLYNWLKKANNFGKTTYEKALSLKNAKIQITYWGANQPTTNLHDYAHKEWNGMLRNFYLPRWKMFVTYCKEQLKGNKVSKPNYFEFEKNWTELPDTYPPQKLSVKKINRIIKEVLK